MKNNQWNPQAKESDSNVATMPATTTNDAAFDKLRYQPTLHAMPAPTLVARQTSPPAGPNANIQAINEEVRNASAWVTPLRQQIGRVIVGQHHLVDRLLIGLITNGHILLEGVPGLAKTLAVNLRRTCCLPTSLAR